MLKLVDDEVKSIEEFMARYKVCCAIATRRTILTINEMDHQAALHRIKVGVPATVEHSSESIGPDAGKWIAETTQVGRYRFCGLKFD